MEGRCERDVRKESFSPTRTEFAYTNRFPVEYTIFFFDIIDHHANFTVALPEQRTIVDISTATYCHAIIDDH